MPKVKCEHCGQLISVSVIDFKNNSYPKYCSDKKCKKGRVKKMSKEENYFQDEDVMEVTKEEKKGKFFGK